MIKKHETLIRHYELLMRYKRLEDLINQLEKGQMELVYATTPGDYFIKGQAGQLAKVVVSWGGPGDKRKEEGYISVNDIVKEALLSRLNEEQERMLPDLKQAGLMGEHGEWL